MKNTRAQKTIVGLGELLWDVFPAGKVLGGAPANFVYHAGSLGCSAMAVSAIGNDAMGREVLTHLSGKGLRTCLQVTSFPTGTVQVTLDTTGVPTYVVTEQVAWDYITFTPELEQLAAATDAVCFGSLAQRNAVSRRTFTRFFEAMSPGSLKIFDINLRQHFYSQDVITASLCVADVLKMNDQELLELRRLYALGQDETEVCRQLLAKYQLKAVILTKGTRGSLVVTAAEHSFLSTPVVHVVDTVGAGDAFTAAFVTVFLEGASVREAHQQAVALSAYVCTQKGAMPPLQGFFCA